MNKLPELTQSLLREFLHYEPTTGVFTWKVTKNNRLKPGAIAGSVRPGGYVNLGVAGRLYLAHRLAWLYIYGVWPEHQIDHINRNKSDNRIANLRDVTQSENVQNTLICSRNSSGYRGVGFDRKAGKWEAKIWHHGRKKWIGYYDNVKDAARAYASAAATHHTHNPAATARAL
jgi:hypothetical protein